jgi:predicted RNA-binding Zn-ribbon protein involved in translation (DUF1610 family)
MGWFGSEAKDRAKLLAAVPTTGATSVDRLAASLNWPSPRVRKLLEAVPVEELRYDPETGRIERPGGPEPASPPATPAPGGAPGEVTPSAFPRICPDCRTPLSPTGTPGTEYCTKCGDLVTRSPAPVGPPSAFSAATPTASSGGRLNAEQTQTLLAAWITDRPIRCPRCLQPLTHRGVESYTCPGCGDRITFQNDGAVAETPPAAAPVGAP